MYKVTSRVRTRSLLERSSNSTTFERDPVSVVGVMPLSMAPPTPQPAPDNRATNIMDGADGAYLEPQDFPGDDQNKTCDHDQ